MNRREFLHGISATAIASLISTNIFSQNTAKLKIVVFWQEGFPIVDGLNITKPVLQTALGNHDLIFADEKSLSSQLTDNIDVFVNPYGSAFPKKSWNAILKYLQDGGNYVNLGGVPFAVPVQNNKAETGQVNYHKRLGITQSFPINSREIESWSEPSAVTDGFTLQESYEYYLKLSNVNDFPEESGSDGRREAKVESLFFGLNKNKLRVAAPIIQIDRLQGEFAGGRWLLASFKGTIEANLIKDLVERTSIGAIYAQFIPYSACFRKDDVLTIKTRAIVPPKASRKLESFSSSFELVFPDGKSVKTEPEGIWSKVRTGEYEGKFDLRTMDKPIMSGYYQVYINSSHRLEKDYLIFTSKHKTGFWVLDEKLLATGEPFTTDRHFLYRNGKPFPVVGTTYMSSDVARRFLLEPNPAVWEKDFSEMSLAGVNMIRTGIWTGWKLYLDEKGDVKEEVLRAFEAFILTAKKYDIQVMFTFYAFMPEMYGGKNAYLDPQSINGQKKFLSAFASRMKSAKDIIWDLINEPSFANPKNLWQCRPNYDEFEKRAWAEFLKKRFNQLDEVKLADILKDKWRLRDDENPFDLPKMEDFDNMNIAVKRRPLKALEFRLFAQEVFKNWAKELGETLKKAGNPHQLVTVGQDEAGTADSPAQQFHSNVMDLTGLHNWWANDDLLCDAVVTKSPEKPNLVQETGLMFYEDQDGKAWRTDQNAANLLSRKMGLSLGANGAGFIEWIWNINPFMDNENEAAIGFHRVSGTAKKELEHFTKFAKFANENRQYFKGKVDEKTLMVIPHSYQFLPRNYAQEATRKAVRVFHYYCRHTLRAVSEYNLAAILREKEVPKLILLPSVNCFNQKAWQQLMQLKKRGSVLAITGYFNDDEHLIPQKRFQDIGLDENFSAFAKPVSSNENAHISGLNFAIHFGGEKVQQVRKTAHRNDVIFDHVYEKDNVLWHYVPLEIGENLKAIQTFYKLALKKARLFPFFSIKNDTPSVLVRPTEFEKAILYLIINESSKYESVQLTHLPTNTPINIGLFAEETVLLFVDKASGKILAKTY